MKNIIKFLGFCCFCVLLTILIALFWPDSFSQSYQRALVRQYQALKKIEGNKIVFVGLSTLAFGLDLNLMEKLTGRPCAMLACHAGLGLANMLDFSKSNLKAGDIVILEYANSFPDEFGAELLLSAIGKQIEMFNYIRPQVYNKLIKAYPSYLLKNILYTFIGGYKSTGGYYLNLFDKRGNMIAERKSLYNNIDEVAKNAAFPKLDFARKEKINNPVWINFVNDFADYCNKNNIRFFISTSVFCKDLVVSTTDIIDSYDAELSKLLKAPIISKSKDYLLPFDMIYNTSTHCNTIGAQNRTKKLYNDIINYFALTDTN